MPGDAVRPSSAGPPPRTIDEDLYCLHCAYNLRGLSGDPVRCPECGHENPVGQAEIPAELVAERLRRMEGIAAVSVILAPFTVLSTAVFFVFAHILVPAYLAAPAWILLFFVAAAWAGEAALVAQFHRYCLGKRGWLSVLVAYHVLGMGAVGLVVGTFVLINWLAWPRLPIEDGHPGAIVHLSLLIAAGIVAVYLIRRFGTPIHRRLIGRMHALQRDVAITLIREDLRKRLSTRRRWH